MRGPHPHRTARLRRAPRCCERAPKGASLVTLVGRSQALTVFRAAPLRRRAPRSAPAHLGPRSGPAGPPPGAILFGRRGRLGGRFRGLRRRIGGPEVPIAGRALPELLRRPRILGAGIAELHRGAAPLATNRDVGMIHGRNCSVPSGDVATRPPAAAASARMVRQSSGRDLAVTLKVPLTRSFRSARMAAQPTLPGVRTVLRRGLPGRGSRR